MSGHRHPPAIHEWGCGETSRRLFTWGLYAPDGQAGSVGVSAHLARALAALSEELQHAPNGTVGVIAAVRLNEWTPLNYETERTVIHAMRDPESGAVVFSP